MTTHRWWQAVVCLFVLALPAEFVAGPVAGDEAGKRAKPRLAVLVVFDQMRGDYPAKWKELFGKGGFRRLQQDGAWFTNCHYPYALTVTAAGHASLVTGTSPYKHGMIANGWYDRESGAMVGAVESAKHRPVPAPRDTDKRIPGGAPVRRRVPTVGDMLLQASRGKGRVVSLSIKDRSSILLAALRALCLWFSTHTGHFGSSTYYMDGLPRWVSDFNKSKAADQWFARDWTRLLPELDYAKHSGIDDSPFEGTGVKQGRTFPHSLKGGRDKIGRDYYQAMTNSPFGNELLLAFAKKAIDTLELGRKEQPDLLCLSFSSNDLVGHCWGPDSQEVLDITLRSDLIVKELMEHLDAKVGKGKYVLAVTADHGICPIPEVAKAQGKDAGRVAPAMLTTRAAAFLDETFGKGEKLPWIEATANLDIYLNGGTLKEAGLEPQRVEKALAGWLAKQPGIKAAYTRTQLKAGPIKDDPLGEKVRLSFHPDCSGDVTVVLKPYHNLSPAIASPKLVGYRAQHGSPWEYDTHVPLFVYGPGIRGGARDERIAPQAVAAILAEALGIEPPPQADYGVPKGLRK